jgi:hypothetical protein
VAAKNGGDVTDEVEKLRDLYLEQPWLGFSSVYGPVPEAVERHDPPRSVEAAAMVQTRFGLFFDLVEDVGAEPPRRGRKR